MADPNNALTPRINDIEKVSDVKNKIINGGFDFWQRGTSFTSINGGFTYFADRFAVGIDSAFAGNLIYTISRESASIPNTDVDYSMRVEVTNPDGSIPTSAKSRITHRVEGNILNGLSGKDIKLSFYAKSNLTQVFGLNAFGGVYDKIFIADFEVTQADTWQRHEITIPWDANIQTSGNTVGLEINWILAAAANLGTTNGWNSYSSGIPFTSSNSDLAGISGALGNYLEITGVMLYDADFGEGIPFQRAGRNYAEEELLCYRYFYKMTPVVGGTVVASGMVFSNPTNLCRFHYEIPVPMRTTPSYLINGNYVVYDGNGNGSALAAGSGTHEMIGTTIVTSNTTSVSMGGTAQTACLYVPTSTPSNRIEFNAEL
jgi:hypothetical protein